jgi:hypothetical protein
MLHALPQRSVRRRKDDGSGRRQVREYLFQHAILFQKLSARRQSEQHPHRLFLPCAGQQCKAEPFFMFLIYAIALRYEMLIPAPLANGAVFVDRLQEKTPARPKTGSLLHQSIFERMVNAFGLLCIRMPKKITSN